MATGADADPELLTPPPGWPERYRPLRRLGAGGGAEVLLATDTERGETVAVKYLRHADAAAAAELLAAPERCARLVHPAIPRILRSHRGPAGAVFLVREHAAGRDLSARIAELRRDPTVTGPAVTLAQRLELLATAGAALAAGHAAGLLHLDCAPGNLIVADDGALQLVDWESAVAMDDAGTARARLGTLAYLAPEQARGEAVDVRSDVAGLAATAFHLLTLRLPTWHDDPERLRARRARGEVDDFTPSERKALPAAVRAALLRALAADPEARYPDVAAFTAALGAGSGGWWTRWRKRGAQGQRGERA